MLSTPHIQAYTRKRFKTDFAHQLSGNEKLSHVVYVLQSDYSFWRNGVKIYVPKGFVFDGATVPWFARWYVPKAVLLRAALLHDWLYINKQFFQDAHSWQRKEIDEIFAEDIKYEMLPRHQEKVVIAAVRGLGWAVWNRKSKPLIIKT